MTGITSRIAKKWQLILYVTFVAGACAFFVSTIITPKYRSDITILIVQKNKNAMETSRSVGYLSEVFSQVIHTELFLNDVFSSHFGIQKQFSDESGKRKKQWENEVKIEKLAEAGILKISVFDSSKVESNKIAQAIAHNFFHNSQKYHGSKGIVEVKLIDGPITSKSPVSPNIPLNTALGLLFGFAGAILIVVFHDSFDLRVVERKFKMSEMVKKQLQNQLRKRQQGDKLEYEQEKSKKPFMSKRKEKQKEEEKEDITETRQVVKKAGVLAKKQDKERSFAEKGEKKGVFARLYGKSLFADKKLEDLKATRTTHHKSQEEPTFPVVESVHKVKQNTNKEIPSQIKKAQAPQNLPIFTDEEEKKDDVGDDDVKKDVSETAFANEFSPIEHMELPSRIVDEEKDFLAEDMQLPERKDDDSVFQKQVEHLSSEFEKTKEKDPEEEPSENEVKRRLNRLLKGEL